MLDSRKMPSSKESGYVERFIAMNCKPGVSTSTRVKFSETTGMDSGSLASWNIVSKSRPGRGPLRSSMGGLSTEVKAMVTWSATPGLPWRSNGVTCIIRFPESGSPNVTVCS